MLWLKLLQHPLPEELLVTVMSLVGPVTISCPRCDRPWFIAMLPSVLEPI